MVVPCLTSFGENQLYRACWHFASVRDSSESIVTDGRSGCSLITGYATASGWTSVTELLLLATIVTGARSVRHDAKGNGLGYRSRRAVDQDEV
jgi:hypothetical protein